jgi:hypothetical protein
MKKNVYIGAWSVNNGTTHSYIIGNNKSDVKKRVKEICSGNVFPGNTGKWSVKMDTENGGYIVDEGITKG